MTWKKRGLIFRLDPSPARSTHTQVPTPLVLADRLRIYYACRNKGQAFPAFIDVDRNDPKKVLRVHEQPVMALGEPGMFDSDGVMPSWAVKNKNELWLYFIGWNARATGARYQNEIGLAVSADGGETFEHMFPGPIIGRSPTEPGLAVMPFVTHENGFRMYYQSLTHWVKIGEQYEPVYVIKYAESLDGVKWDRHPEQVVHSNYPLEAFSRPCVIKRGDFYHMYYCYRASEDYRGGRGSYRIGHADSADGVVFIRTDEHSGVGLGQAGEFDSEMMCYPAIAKVGDKEFLFYNGNSFGQTGIGYAVWED